MHLILKQVIETHEHYLYIINTLDFLSKYKIKSNFKF